MERNRLSLCLSCVLFFSYTSCTFAESYTARNNTFELRLGTGYLTGESGEYVYDAYGLASGIPGYKVSQLDWKIDNAFMAGIGASFTPVKRLRFNVDYWRDAVDGQATMDDYDWMYVGLDWSHWSHTENTKATEISNVNVNGEWAFLRLEDDQTDFTLLLGYKKDHFKWVAVGGYGIYSSTTGYRDTYVIFPDTPGITYEQNFTTPYVGLGFHTANDSKIRPIVLSANVLYSKWVRGEDADTHHYRNLYFEESGDGGTWLSINASMEFNLTQRMALTFAYAYQNFGEIKASTTVTDQTTGIAYYYPGQSAGLDHSSNMLSAQLGYRF